MHNLKVVNMSSLFSKGKHDNKSLNIYCPF